jgi:hypothetical protein
MNSRAAAYLGPTPDNDHSKHAIEASEGRAIAELEGRGFSDYGLDK